MADELDLVALRRPCYVILPLTERRVAIRFFRAEQKQIYKQWMAEPNNPEPLLALLRHAIPGLTDAELDDLSLDEDIPRIIGKANGKAALVEVALKNGVSDGVSLAPSPTPASPPTTTSPTSSPKSRKRSTGRRTNSSTSTGIGSSSPSTG
jgi:hypothetical protein